jgi:hypothetical protein
MATITSIIAAVATVLEGVTGIGRVNQYERYFENMSGFQGFHGVTEGGTPVINSATVSLSAIRPAATKMRRGGSAITQLKERTVEIKLIRGQSDAEASQIKLAELADAVFDAFDTDAAHAALAVLGLEYEPPEIATIGLAGYGNPPFIVVNQAVVTLNLREVLS